MQVLANHRLDTATYVASPNCDARPLAVDLTTVVIHCISLPKGQFRSGLPQKLFTNSIDFDVNPELEELRDIHVSAHVLIGRDGEVIQFVPFNERAWHAGVSSWQGQSNCNDNSIGIELEGTDDSAFEAAQYDSLVEVLVALLGHYPTLSLSNVVGHSEIARGRKSDPGRCFDWTQVFSKLIDQLAVVETGTLD